MLRSSDIAAARFSTTKFREGYDQGQVDAYLAQTRLALEACERTLPPALRGDDVANTRFDTTKFRAGYDQDQIDNFLDEVVAALREHGH